MPRLSRSASKKQRFPQSFWSKLFGEPVKRERARRSWLGIESLEDRWVMANPVVTFQTNMGNIDFELFADTQPITVQNFLDYVNDDSYIDSIIHRSVPNFVIQGGGFTTDEITFEDVFQINEIFTNDPIQNEPGRLNNRGTLAMAKVGGDPNSATSQFFVNLRNNTDLNTQNGGFTVFGQVINNGMTVVDAIAALTRVDIDPPDEDGERVFPDGQGGSILGSVPMFRVASGTPINQLVTVTSITGNGFIQGSVYKDLNKDGVRALDSADAGTLPDEPGLAGITVFVDANDNGTLDTGEISTVTNASGDYELTVPSGTHLVRQVSNNPFITVDPDGEEVDVEIGRAVTGVNFGNFSDTLASFTIEVTRPDGTVIAPGTSLKVGDQFKLNIFVEDPSPGVISTDQGIATTGVENAALDVLFNRALADYLTITPNAATNPDGVDITFGANYQFSTRIDASTPSDALNELQAGHTLTGPLFAPAGAGKFLVATVDMVAKSPGAVTFQTDPADESNHTVVVATTNTNGTSGPNIDPVPNSQISFGSAQINIVSDLAAVNDSLFVKLDSTNNTLNVLANDTKNPAGTLIITGVGPGATNSFVTPHGTVTRSGDNLSLVYTPTPGFTGEDTFTYTVSDGTGAPVSTATVTVTVQDLPAALPDSATVAEDSSNNVITVLTNDLANEGRTNSITAVSDPAHGTATLITSGANAGKINYTPDPNFFGNDSFTYTIADGSGATDVGTVTVTVTNASDPPTAAADTATTAEETAIAINVLANDTDIDNDPVSNVGLTVNTFTQQPANGTVSIITSGVDAGKVLYTPNLNFFGTDTFKYTVKDTQNNISSEATVTVTVTNTQDAPTAGADTFTITRNTGPHTFDVRANDTDVDNNPVSNVGLTVTSISTPPQNGTAAVSGGTAVTYTPTAGFIGTDTFQYTITDGTTPVTATVTVQVLDFIPSTLSGFVYIDANQNGVKDAGELVVEGTNVTITGTGLAGAVNQTKATSTGGFYEFTGLAPGSYNITQTPPLFLVDGAESSSTPGATFAPTDTISFTNMVQDTQGTNNNFGELRRQPAFTRLSDYFAIRGDMVIRAADEELSTIQVALQGSSTQLWMTRSGDWKDVVKAEVRLVNNGASVQLDITDANQVVTRTTIPLTDTDHVQVLGTSNGATLLRISGNRSEFTFGSAANTAPTATITPATYSATEQTALTLAGTGLSVADADAGDATVTATVAVVSGVINATAGTTGVTVGGSGTNSVTLSGTLAQINSLLSGTLGATLSYLNSSNTPAATDTLTLTVNDGGATGSGGALTGSDTATINVAAVNDAPTATITPATYAASEGTALTLAGTGITIADVDAGTASVTATVAVVSGALTATAGTTGVTIAGSGTNSITLTGTLTQINDLLAGSLSGTLSYLNNSETATADTLTVTVSDGGNTGTGGTLTGSDTATFNITAVNDAPTATITPATYAATEGTTLTLAGTGLSIADVDAASASVTASVSVVSGTLSATAGTTGVAVAGSGTSSVTLTGTLAQINNLLAGNLSGTLNYLNSDAPSATDTLTLLVNDGGSTGSGGSLTGSDTATINLTITNDAPTATITSATFTVDEQVSLVLAGAGLSVADVDAGTATVTATVAVVSGAITATPGTTGVTIDGSGTNSVTLSGTLAQINSLLSGTLGSTLSYLNSSDTPVATDTLTLSISDGGATGTGGTLTGSDTATINITAVNDAPTATITPTTYAADEDVSLTLSGTGLSIADVDADAATVTATVSVVSGTLTAVAGTTGVTVGTSGTNSVTLTGTLAQINNLLAGNLGSSLSYLEGASTLPATDTLTLSVNDGGATGTGGSLTGSDTATIQITDAVNTAPTATITPASFNATEQTALTLAGAGLSVADEDAGNAIVTATVSVVSGAITADAGTTGVVVADSGTSSVTLTGTLAEINNLLAGNFGSTLSYLNNSDTPVATDTLTLSINDGGATGTGGALSGSDTATINIEAVNDAPTATITPASFLATEDVELTLSGTGLAIADVDADAATVTATVSVVTGTLTAVAGTTGVTVGTSGTSSVTLTGTLAQINNLLAGNLGSSLSFLEGASTFPATDTLTLSVNDGGATGAGGSLTGSDTAIINITDAANNAPTATITPPSFEATEQVSLTLSGTGLSVADEDAGNATVTVTVSVVSGIITATAGATGVTVADSETSTVTLSGTLAQINDLLSGNLGGSLSYINNSDTPPATDTLTLAINDGGATGTGGPQTGSDTATINITDVAEPPVLTTTVGDLAFTENDPATVIDSGLTVTDADSADLTGATVTISTNYLEGEDVLTFTNQLGITGSFNATTGILTLSGTTTVANYQTALRTVAYQNASDNPSNRTRTFSFVATDGTANSVAATRNITVAVTNDAPVVTTTGTPLAYAEDAAATAIDSGLTVTDVDDTLLNSATVTISANYVNGEDVLAFTNQSGITGVFVAATGVLTLTGSSTVANYQAALRSITYQNTSNNPSTSDRTVSFVVNDGSLDSVAATRNIAITVSNDAPALTATVADLAYTENDAAIAIDSGLSVSDADNADITGATVAITTGYVNGEDVLAFTDQLGITGSFNPGTGVLTLSGTASVANYQTALRSVTYQNTSENPSVSARTVSFVANDGSLDSTAATRNIVITAANDAPVLTATVADLAYTENDAATAVDSGLTVSDIDNANLTGATVAVTTGYVDGEDVLAFTNQLGITGNFNSTSGVLTLSGTATVAEYQTALRSVTYQNLSDAPSTTARTVSFVVNDGTANSNVATRNITITAVNDDPTAVADTSGTLQDTPVSIDVLANDFDVDNGLPQSNTGLEILIFDTTSAQLGTVEVGGSPGLLLYTPATGFTGSDTFNYTVKDADGNNDTAEVTVNVTGGEGEFAFLLNGEGEYAAAVDEIFGLGLL